MPLQNRVAPNGEIIATCHRGNLMGNRGILHRGGQIVRSFMHKGWVTCQLDFGGIHREVMTEGRYTELFFLDEAVAFAAGHRPCFNCQREKFRAFKNCWIKANARLLKTSNPSMMGIDRILHSERIGRLDEKITYQDSVMNIVDGTFIEYESTFRLKWRNAFFQWSPAGYTSSITLPEERIVKVLTPRSIVRCFQIGLIPSLHETIQWAE